jgi:hypothetical protein
VSGNLTLDRQRRNAIITAVVLAATAIGIYLFVVVKYMSGP